MDYEMVGNCQVENLNQIYLDYFGYKTDGVFVEVGAYDGYNFSNTWGLARAGWKGFYIEPIQEYVQACMNNHKGHNVSVIQKAVGNFSGTVRMQIAGTLSTYDDFYIKSSVWGSQYKNNTVEVDIDTLDNILLTRVIHDEIDVLVIDTEGSELKVLEGFDLEYWRPKMVIIEAHEKNPYKELTLLVPDIDNYFSSYRKIYAGEVNSIYVIN